MLTVPDTIPFWRKPGSAFGFSPNATPPNRSLAPVASSQFVWANRRFRFAVNSVTFPLWNVHAMPSTSRPRDGTATSATNVPFALFSTAATPTSPVGNCTDRLTDVPAARSSSLITPSWTYAFRSGPARRNFRLVPLSAFTRTSTGRDRKPATRLPSDSIRWRFATVAASTIAFHFA